MNQVIKRRTYIKQGSLLQHRMLVGQLKRCCGYKGVWLCDEPDHMLSLDKFSDDKYSQDGKQPMCKKCRVPMDADRWGRRPKHKVTGEGKSNWKQRVAKGLGGTPNTPEWQGFLDKAESLWDVEIKNHLLDTAPVPKVLEFLFPETKESVVTQRTVNHKTRNQALATKLKELYNYTCQAEDCNETEVEIAHIYKHSLPDSVDDETNAWCLCCNHHRAYDANRMELMPYPMSTHALRFIRYNRFGEAVEISRIIYDEKHTVNIKWIKKAREYRDRKK